MIDKEDFEAWRTSPVTEAIFDAMRRIAAGAREEWLAATWNDAPLDIEKMILRANLKGKEQTYTELTELTFEDFDQWQQSQ